jgi:predicted  nucleic acid-binding Zn-ribbon protein
MNDKNLERKVNKILDELPEVVIDLAVYAENLEREIDKLEKTIKDMSDRITELEVSFLELKKP